jgi:two-component system, NtrC family, response regulator
MTRKLLVIDDKINIRRVLEDILRASGYDVITAGSGEEGVILFEEHCPDLVLTDMKMDGMTGVELVRTIRKQNKWVPIILFTAYGSIPSAVDAMKAGANDYLTKPLDYALLRAKIQHTIADLKAAEDFRISESSGAAGWGLDDLIGQSMAMRRVKSMIRTVARSDSSVLIEGEGGTGKELIARSLFAHSPRSNASFVVVDCSAIPEHLIESELFGYEKGAFTGASAQKRGRFEQADGGTLFLDEIGELPLNCQAKMLRVIQEKQLVRVGGQVPVNVDFRLIAATNKRLKDEVAANRFRSDLFYRLNVISIESPPLRARMEDLPLLIDFFWRHSCAENHLPARVIGQRHMQAMLCYTWPGNIRELKNCIERLVLLDSLPPEIETATGKKAGSAEKPTLSNIERDLVADMLAKCDWNISHAARELGIGRKALYNRIRKYNLTAP